MIKNKKQSLIVIGAFILVLLLGTTTYAFFNYTRTGTANTIRVGRISFITRQLNTINLTNVFPIDKANVNTDTDNVDEVVIEIVGDTDYFGGIEYLVSSKDANIYTSSNIQVPVSLDVTIDDDLGTSNANYFTARENTNESIYKKLVGDTLVGDQMLLVGYIVPNSESGEPEGIDGTISIKAYFDKDKILISDTYDGTESDPMGTTNNDAEGKTVISTSEWNELQQNGVSFKIKVEANEGIWVNGSLEEIMKRDNIGIDLDNGVDFSKTSEQDGLNSEGTKGVYMRDGTQNDTYPILYYRGAVEDNNVVFNNKCWKTVRTTDTGGVKLIYNGIVSTNKTLLSQTDYGTPVSNNGFTFDTTDNSWNATMTTNITSSEPYEISFNVPSGDGYVLQLSGVPTSVGGVAGLIYKGGTQVMNFGGGTGTPFAYTRVFGSLTSNSSDIIKVTYYMSGGNSTVENPSTIKVKMIHSDETLGMGCDNSGTDSQISLNNTNQFHFSGEVSGKGLLHSPSYVGYMRGTNIYEYNKKISSSTFKFGTGFTYNNGTYTLTNAGNGITSTRHYTCFTTSEICNGENIGKIYYVYYKNGNNYIYIELENGKSVEDALIEMETNEVDSNAKEIIEDWYEANMTSYTNRIEDTIYCNDRSMNTQTNGWIANGGTINENLHYAPYGRVFTTYIPSLDCINKNDSFTWKNSIGNGKLEYPVGMITADEIMLAGGKGTSASTYYLTTGVHYWSMSPYNFFTTYAKEFSVYSSGSLGDGVYMENSSGLRPVISLKPGQLITKGIGTVTDPYVIE